MASGTASLYSPTRTNTSSVGNSSMSNNQGTLSSVNFRQIGRHVGGRRFKGRIDLSRKSISSIPSKFETTLFKGNKESKGFVSGSLRFKPSGDTDNPGPGSYDSCAPRSTESFSKKGYGNLASSSSRFSTGQLTYFPGPGENHCDVPKYRKARSYRSSFASKVARIPAPRVENTIGPGAYYKSCQTAKVYKYTQPVRTTIRGHRENVDGENPDALGNKARVMPVSRAPFTTCESRFPMRLPKKSPAPGTYSPKLIPYGHGATNVFKSTRDREPEPARSPKNMMIHIKPPDGPGPGAYMQVDQWGGQKPAAHRFFAQNNANIEKSIPKKTTFFSNIKTDAPGPGAYNPHFKNNIKEIEAANASWEQTRVVHTKTLRGYYEPLSSAPGPAYYETAKAKRISYNTRVSQKWI